MAPTPSKRKHHFVPKLYLRAFASAPNRIHIYNLRHCREIRDASLRDQCYQHRFYGPTDELEDHLMALEDAASPVVRAIGQDQRLPPAGSPERELLFAFVAVQLLRTTVAADRVNRSVDKITKQAFRRDPRIEGINVDAVRVEYDHPVIMSLRALPKMLYAISDLKAHLVTTTENLFFTSDNPVFRYNQYCERVRDVGVTGGLCRGLQIFMPISPTALLLLHDASVYKVGDLRSDISPASDRDVEILNTIQVVSASENLYFSNWHQARTIGQLVRKVRHYRSPDPTQVYEYAEEDETHSLLHLFERIPNLRLSLSFMRIRRDPRRVPLYDRVSDYRKPLPMPDLPLPPHLRGRTLRFSRPVPPRD